jgi:hypothetical protein
MSQSSGNPWDWRGLAPVPLPEDLKDIGTEELVRAYQSMEDRLQRMTLLIEAMRELLHNAGLFSESALREVMDRIDLRDGALDGRATKQFQRVCTSCGSTTSELRRFCQTCGSEALSAVP